MFAKNGNVVLDRVYVQSCFVIRTPHWAHVYMIREDSPIGHYIEPPPAMRSRMTKASSFESVLSAAAAFVHVVEAAIAFELPIVA